jgi:serine/threonine-protein kinase
MATVYLANSGGEAGFSRLVAIKVLHPHLAEQEDFVAMLLEEARLAARIHHPNVVPVVDLQSDGNQRYIVMEYVEGCAFSDLLRRQRGELPLGIVIAVIRDALNGLHAAHSLTDTAGTPLNLIHRDVSPHNILVGVDGMARLTDFGVALAQTRIHHTRQRELKGKLAFMAPEQIRCLPLDCRADIFSVGCLLWLALTGKSLFLGANDAATLANVLNREIVPPRRLNQQVPEVLDTICVRALDRDPNKRWSTAAEMEEALHQASLDCDLVVSRKEITEWVKRSHKRELDERRHAVRDASMLYTASASLPSSVGQPSIAAVGPSAGDLSPAVSARVVKSRGFFRSPLGLALIGAILLSAAGGAFAIVAKKGAPASRAASLELTPAPAGVPGHPTMEVLPLPSAGVLPAAAPSVKPTVTEIPTPAATVDEETPAMPVTTGGKSPRAKVPGPRRPSRTTSSVGAAPATRAVSAPISPPSKAPAAWDKDSPLPPQ